MRRRRRIFAIRIRQCSRRHYVKVSSSSSGYKRSVPGLLDTKHGHSEGGREKERTFRSEKCVRGKGQKSSQLQGARQTAQKQTKEAAQKTKLEKKKKKLLAPCSRVHKLKKSASLPSTIKAMGKCGQNVEQVRYNIGDSSADQVLR